jgi:N-acetylneuraminic acid mutarotase
MRSQSKNYRPELHYMRGPGPKWREKNAVPATPSIGRSLARPNSMWLIPAVTAVLVLAATALALA